MLRGSEEGREGIRDGGSCCLEQAIGKAAPPCGRSSKCKGPGVGAGLRYSGNSKEAHVTGTW